jgi:NTP pyrophosphatase (non-canonical NTP hydrolase)
MKLNDYQEAAKETIVYPQRTLANNSMATGYETGILYNALNLASEAGEVAGLVAKAIRKDTEVPLDKLKDEMSDILWNLSVLSYELGFTLEEVAQHNINKLQARKSAGTLKER